MTAKKKISPLEALRKRQEAERVTLLKENIPTVVDYLEAETNAWAKRNGYSDSTPKKELSKKAQEIRTFLANKPFGCNTEAVKTVMSILLEEDISLSPQEIEFDAENIILVPLKCLEGSHYHLGIPYISVGDGNPYFINSKNEDGFKFSTRKDYIRPATRKEIQNFMTQLVSRKILPDWLEALFETASK